MFVHLINGAHPSLDQCFHLGLFWAAGRVGRGGIHLLLALSLRGWGLRRCSCLCLLASAAHLFCCFNVGFGFWPDRKVCLRAATSSFLVFLLALSYLQYCCRHSLCIRFLFITFFFFFFFLMNSFFSFLSFLFFLFFLSFFSFLFFSFLFLFLFSSIFSVCPLKNSLFCISFTSGNHPFHDN